MSHEATLWFAITFKTYAIRNPLCVLTSFVTVRSGRQWHAQFSVAERALSVLRRSCIEWVTDASFVNRPGYSGSTDSEDITLICSRWTAHFATMPKAVGTTISHVRWPPMIKCAALHQLLGYPWMDVFDTRVKITTHFWDTCLFGQKLHRSVQMHDSSVCNRFRTCRQWTNNFRVVVGHRRSHAHVRPSLWREIQRLGHSIAPNRPEDYHECRYARAFRAVDSLVWVLRGVRAIHMNFTGSLTTLALWPRFLVYTSTFDSSVVISPKHM